jgi:protein-disulfide isomerase
VKTRRSPCYTLLKKQIMKVIGSFPAAGGSRLAGLLLVAGLLAIWALAGPVSASRAAVRRSPLSLAGVPQHNEVLGSSVAPVTMVYFDDPQCRFCREWHTGVLPTLVRRYVRTGELQIHWEGFSIIGPDSVTGVRFILAAGLQNHLWDVLDDVLANQREENSGWLTPPLLEQVGTSIPGFNVPQAIAAVWSRTVANELSTGERLGRRWRLRGVPSILLGRRKHGLRLLNVNALTPAEFTRPIARLLSGGPTRTGS